MEKSLETTLVEEIAQWQVRTRALMLSMLELTAYYGPRDARRNLERALECPAWIVERVGYPQEPLVGMPGPTGIFRTRTKRLATVLSPLVELVGGPVPWFVSLSRVVPNGMPTLIAFGEFSGRFGGAMTYPLWSAHRELAPEHWLRVFGRRLKRRRPA